MSKKIKWIIVFSCLALYVAVVTLATFFDYQISQAIAKLPEGQYISSSVLGKIFEVIGESPMYLAGAFASTILLRKASTVKRNVREYTVVLSGICGIIILTSTPLFTAFFKASKMLVSTTK